MAGVKANKILLILLLSKRGEPEIYGYIFRLPF